MNEYSSLTLDAPTMGMGNSISGVKIMTSVSFISHSCLYHGGRCTEAAGVSAISEISYNPKRLTNVFTVVAVSQPTTLEMRSHVASEDDRYRLTINSDG